MLKRILTSVAVGGAALSLIVAARSGAVQPVKVGAKAPAFTSSRTVWPLSRTGKATSLAQFKNKVVLINFFDYN